MLLSAQRVVTPYGAEGINAFKYAHPDVQLWPYEDATVLLGRTRIHRVGHHLALPPGGNRVRSYVDLVVPPEITVDDITACLQAFIDLPVLPNTPINFPGLGCGVRFAVELALWPTWKTEFLELASQALVAT